MFYPKLRPLPEHREMTDIFLGYNHNLKNRRGESYDQKNMTSDFFPVLSPRGARGVYRKLENPQGLIAKTALVYIDGTKVVVDGYEVDMGLSTAPEDCPKQLIGMGAFVIIMPDKKYINALNVSDRGDIEAEYTTSSAVTFEPCNILGEVYECTVSPTAPESPVEGTVWIDTSVSPHEMKKYTVTTKMWVVIPQTYIKITSTGIGKNFGDVDGVRITGVTASGLTDLKRSTVIQARNDDSIVVIGLADGKVTQTDPVTISRKMPKMDYLTECNNRLWGCRFGTADNGQIVNEIYASKLGDFKNWECYQGISTDSYTVSVGSDGPFTGAATIRNNPTFYKADMKHKVFGSSPASFGLVSTNCEGVGQGNSRSIAIVNEMAFYMSTTGVCVDDGTLPQKISDAFGTGRYRNGVGGASGSKYFLSCQGSDGKWNAFVWDTEKRMWNREDSTRAMAIESYKDEVYYIDADTKEIKTMHGSGQPESEPIEWMVESGLLGTDSPDSKWVSKVAIRLALDVGTRVHVFVQYDSIGDWIPLGNVDGTNLRTFSFPVRLQRCDHYRMRIVGIGGAKIFGSTKTIEEGF